MRLRLRVCDHGCDGWGEELPTVEVGADMHVRELRDAIARAIPSVHATGRLRMMCRGRLLSDDASSLKSVRADDNDEISVSLWKPSGYRERDRGWETPEAGDGVAKFGGLGPSGIPFGLETLAMAFPLSRVAVSTNQTVPDGRILSMFTEFVAYVRAGYRSYVKASQREKTAIGGCGADASRELSDSTTENELACSALSPWVPSEGELAALGKAVKMLLCEDIWDNETPHVTWHPAYGCCLVASRIRVSEVSLELIGLDGWEFRVHGMGSEHTADARLGGSTSMFSDNIHPSQYAKLLSFIADRVKTAEGRKGDERSAGLSSNAGHQKTPSFIYAALSDGVAFCNGKIRDRETTPRSGTTDVGLHTGTTRRNTSWPLICAVVHRSLDASGHERLFLLAMTYLELWLAEGYVCDLTFGKALPKFLDVAVEILQSAARRAVKLVDIGYDIPVFELRCSVVRAELDALVDLRNLSCSEKYTIAESDMAIDQELACRDPTIRPPLLLDPVVTGKTSKSVIKEASKNIGALPLLDPHSVSWTEILQWFEFGPLFSCRSTEATLLSLSTVESFVFHRAMKLNDNSFVVTNSNIPQIEKLLEVYRRRATGFRESEEGALLGAAQLLSLEVLVAWICLCFVHKCVKKTHPLLLNYGMALDFRSLRHLVLSGSKAVDAAYHVSSYIQDHRKDGLELFSLKSEADATMAYAGAQARRCVDIQQIYEAERNQMRVREAKHWLAVVKKQTEAADLREDLAELEIEQREAASILAGEEKWEFAQHHSYNRRIRDDYKAAEAKNRICCDAVRHQNKLIRIRYAEKPPADVLHALPEDNTLSYQVLFFLYMPSELNSLARLTVMAQQMLLPRSSSYSAGGIKTDVDTLVSVPNTAANWLHYFNSNRSRNCVRKASAACLTIHASALKAPGRVGPANVRDFASARDGVFYPDELAMSGSICIRWDGGDFPIDGRSCGCFNPFQSGATLERLVADYFTAKLDEEDASLQWAMPQFGFDAVGPARGNFAIAHQVTRPSWMSKTAFFVFSGLRAYPNQQLRKLCLALRDRDLPLTEVAVHKIFGQLLFQLGELALSCRDDFLTWHGDRHAGIWEAIAYELNALAEELRYKPREHKSFPVIAQVAAYVSQHNASSASLEAFMAASARNWAQGIDVELESVDSIEARAALHARQCLFSLYAVEGYGSVASEVTDCAWENICCATVQADSRLVLEDTSMLKGSIRNAHLRVMHLQARRAWRLAQAVEADHSILTKAVKSVIRDFPQDLVWKRLCFEGGKYETCCYNATSADGCVYSLNVLSGCILLDGMPLQRLPTSILESPLYRRVFGGPPTNFEVTNSQNGTLKTARPVGPRKRFYSFSFRPTIASTAGSSSDTRLVVCEFDGRGNDGDPVVQWELLDTSRGTWAADLPLRLQKMHSHWLCRSNGVLLLRPTLYSEVGTNYVLKEEEIGKKFWCCYRIPRHLVLKNWDQPTNAALARLDRLVLSDTPLIRALQKFETNKQFIHTFVSQSSRVLYELPRYDLVFAEDKIGNGNCAKSTIASRTFAGFDLCENQQTCTGLGSFEQYIVLEKRGCSGVYRVILPDGNVVASTDGRVSIFSSDRYNASRRWHVFDVHPRFGYLAATGIQGRLQLAAVYAGIGSRLPCGGLTGYEMAMTLVRHCWTNCPLSDDEVEHLTRVSELGRCCPGLVLLCCELAKSAKSLSRLHNQDGTVPLKIADSATAYLNEKRSSSMSYRAELTPAEEKFVCGRIVHRRARRPLQPQLEVTVITDKEFQEHDDLFERIEDRLGSLLSFTSPYLDISIPNLSVANSETDLGQEFLVDLETSTNRFAAQKAPSLSCSFKEAMDACVILAGTVTSARSSMEARIVASLECVDNDVGFRIARSTAICASVTLLDLARLSFDCEDMLLLLNPMLGPDTVARLLRGSLIWLQLCVLEDKLSRLMSCPSSHLSEFIGELDTRRVWDARKHPKWLVFEVEQQLQIRPIQHFLVDYLLNNPEGNLTQLNVGLGKTRVVVPMLLLHCSDPEERAKLGTPRVYFLPQLLSEAYEFLHRTLCASLLNIRLFRMPFTRDVKFGPTNDLAAQVAESLSHCQENGALVLAPQERLSLILKTTELKLGNADATTLCHLDRAVGDQDPGGWLDIIDESDEILRHSNQLVYAMGSCIDLPQGPVRWKCAHLVLEALRSTNVANALRDGHITRITPSAAAGALDEICLISGRELEERWPIVLNLIASFVIEKREQSMKWMAEDPWKARVVRFVCSPQLSYDEWTKDIGHLTPRRGHQVLALRAMLACGLLEHCLSKRHRVSYGVDRRRGSARRVAVPFRYSDTPSDRSEFAHPDAQILYTSLAYLYDGLSEAELREALSKLSDMGPQARRQEYNSWLRLSRPRIFGNNLRFIDSELKLDPTSQTQFELLHVVFRSNFRTVTFFLRECMFPKETKTFPQQLRATSWRLSDNKHVIGFSGTDDSKRLLPLHIEQTQPDLDQLVSTNGEMAKRMCESHVDSSWDTDGNDARQSVWRSLLQHTIGLGSAALIDCGALLTGVQLESAAEYATSLLVGSRFKGVVYFGNSGDWVVCSLDLQKWALSRSPIHESDAFVIFDESHCRGADMRLKRDAMAVVSLGVNVCKDKLIQAVGRMRQLGPGRQTVRFAVPQEVRIQLESASLDCSALGILNWCISNSISAVAAGLTEWLSQGMHYSRLKATPENACEDEVLDLEHMYKSAVSKESVILKAKADRERQAEAYVASVESDAYKDSVEKIMTKVTEIGAGFSVCASQGMGEECERELENEREAQREVQREVVAASPFKEVSWEYALALEAGCISELPVACGVYGLADFVRDRLKLSCFDKRSFPGLFGTRNFFETLEAVARSNSPSPSSGYYFQNGTPSSLRDCLRPVDAGLMFSSGEVLLLSEREADCILGSIWARRGSQSTTGPWFINYSYLRVCASDSRVSLATPRCPDGNHLPVRCGQASIGALQIFNGDTMFRDGYGQEMKERLDVIQEVLSSDLRKSAALQLPIFRGKGIHIDGSDLQRLTADDDV